MKRAVQSALRQSAKGVRVEISGRLNGAELPELNGTERQSSTSYFKS